MGRGEIVRLIEGGRHEDGRGVLRFCNDFDMGEVKRFYTIANSAECPKRGWIMHRRETKWFFPMRGKSVVRVVNAEERRNGEGERISHGERGEHGEEKPCRDVESVERECGGRPAAQEGKPCRVGEGERISHGERGEHGEGVCRSATQEEVFVLEEGRPQVLCVPPGNWFLIEQEGGAEVQVFSNCRVGEFANDDFRKEISQIS